MITRRSAPAIPKEMEGKNISLWDLLTLLSGGAAIGGALAASKVVKADIWHELLFPISTVVVAICCIGFVRNFRRRLLAEIRRNGDGASDRSRKNTVALGLMYAFAMVWLVISAAIGFWITVCVIRL